MNNSIFRSIVSSLLILVVFNVNAQTDHINSGIQTENFNKDPLFGNNIFINYRPDQDQRNIAICSAFNGWLYACYSYMINTQPYAVILRSEDKGKTWITLLDAFVSLPNNIIKKIDIIASGTEPSNIKIFLGMIIYYPSLGGSSGFVARYNGITGSFEDQIFYDPSDMLWDLSIADDNNYSASGSNPYSIAIICSKRIFSKDSVNVYTSSNGGMSLDGHFRVTGSSKHLCNVDVSYGRSASFPNGRYFISWEEKLNDSSRTGHLYTSHSEPNFNSPFTTPVQLDNLYPLTSNKINNPVISCQASQADNDQIELTELVICERYDSASHRSDIVGFSNKNAVTSSGFQLISIDSSTNNKVQPDLCFNSFDSTFLLTYYDSTDIRLPLLSKNFNLLNPSVWNIVSNKYNTENNLSVPHPEVVLDFAEQSAAIAWLGDQTGGNRAAMFDAQFNFPVGVKENKDKELFVCNFYPNPATTFIDLDFYLNEKEYVTVRVLNSLGQCLGNPFDQSCLPGINKIKLDLSTYTSGFLYLRRSLCLGGCF